MHELEDPRNSLPSASAVQKECIGCGRMQEAVHFRRDSSYRDGRRDLCVQCEESPRMSTAEHTHRLREMNANSEAIRRQRADHQEDYKDDASRVGRVMSHSVFLGRLKKLVPNLYITEGNVVGKHGPDWAVFRTFGVPQARLDGRTFEYLFYVPSGPMPEYSQYEFDANDVLVREKQRGWRTPLLRLIKAGLLTQERCDEEFGSAVGAASTVWYRQLFVHRNKHE